MVTPTKAAERKRRQRQRRRAAGLCYTEGCPVLVEASHWHCERHLALIAAQVRARRAAAKAVNAP